MRPVWKLRADSGQTAAEYLGLLTIVALVIALIASAGIGQALRTTTTAQVCRILEASTCATPSVPAQPAPAAPVAGRGGDLLDGVGDALDSVAGGVVDVAGGFGAQGWEMVKGVGETGAWAWRSLTSVEQRADNGEVLEAVVDDPGGALRALWDGSTASIRAEWDHGRPAAATGRATAELASMVVVPGKLLAKLKLFREMQTLRAALRGADALPTPEEAAVLICRARPIESALKSDRFHRSATFAVELAERSGTVFRITGRDGAPYLLVQAPGELNEIPGRFEWILDERGNLTHQVFVRGGGINGVANVP